MLRIQVADTDAVLHPSGAVLLSSEQTLLIADIRMPEMDGYELAEAAIALNHDIKILMLTGYPEMRIPPPALQAREIRTLMKPVELDRLCTVALDMLSRP